MSWICPICREPLLPRSGSLVCSNSHSYDVARGGYVNLLGGKKLAASVGDTDDMLISRRRFFESGAYDPLREALVEIALETGAKTIADIGCGEGYYVRGMVASLPGLSSYGTDISKTAISMAARSTPDGAWAVADTNAMLPLPDCSVDMVLNIFAPRNNTEFARIIASNGRLIVVVPAGDHLIELREAYGLLSVQDQKLAAVEATLTDFSLVSSREIAYEMNLDSSTVQNLIGMTPSARFVARLALPEMSLVGAHFVVMIFRKNQWLIH